MKAFLAKEWPFLLHALAVVVLFLNPAVQAEAVAHPAYAGTIALAWGRLLVWATSSTSAKP